MHNNKILAISSGGGHWWQLCRLKPAFEGLDVTYASVYKDYSSMVAGSDYLTFTDFSRFNKLKSLKSAFEISLLILKIRPNVVITTGSAPALFALAFAKIFLRSKTIWIDSVANIETLSTSGKMARHVADVWLTQWEHLSSDDGPKWKGSVI